MKILMISFLTAAADLISKRAVNKKIKTGEKVHIKNRLYIWHVKNRGIAYNKLENDGRKVLALSLGAFAAVLGYLVYKVRSGAGFIERLGIALLLGGGLGNLAERLKNKEVTDFIYVDYKKAPIFNVADVAAAVGAVITAVCSLKE